jgi:hypothetical protein
MTSRSLVVFRILGVLAAVGGGPAAFAVSNWTIGAFGNAAGNGAVVSEAVLAAVALVVGVLSGWLLRTWWALLVVPVLFDVATVAALSWAAGSSVHSVGQVFALAAVFVAYFLPAFLLLVSGAAMGTAIAKRGTH